MNTLRRSLLLGFATLALAGCASKPNVFRIADPDVDFDSYRTFAFVPVSAYPSLIDRHLLAAARSQMERRGYAFDELAPDLLVNIAAPVQTEDYRLGRMAIDLIDARRRQVVWHGVAEGRVSPAMLRRDAGTAVETAVAAVFEAFPIQARAPAAARAPKVHDRMATFR